MKVLPDPVMYIDSCCRPAANTYDVELTLFFFINGDLLSKMDCCWNTTVNSA